MILKNVFSKKVDNLVLIMAGGHGSRLKPYTDILPKPLIPINNKPMILQNRPMVLLGRICKAAENPKTPHNTRTRPPHHTFAQHLKNIV